MNWGTFLTAMGYVTGGLVFWRLSRKAQLDSKASFVLLATGFTAGILGARLVQALASGQPQSAVDPSSGGRAVLGGVLVGWLAVAGVKKLLKIQASTGRAFAHALPAGEAVGRIGCFFNGCCYGTPSAAPWAVYQHGEMRHPSQLYASMASLLVLALVALYSNKEPSDRNVFLFYLACWGATRLLIEVFRVHDTLWLGLGAMQIAGLETAVFSTVLLSVNRLRTTRT